MRMAVTQSGRRAAFRVPRPGVMLRRLRAAHHRVRTARRQGGAGETIVSGGLSVLGAVLGAVGVALGAFGAHGLRTRLSPEMLAVFETGVRYHLIHALALVVMGLAAARWPAAGIGAAGWLTACGVVVFSGSLYVLALTGVRWLGAITPIGGVAMIAGWLWFAARLWQASRS